MRISVSGVFHPILAGAFHRTGMVWLRRFYEGEQDFPFFFFKSMAQFWANIGKREPAWRSEGLY